MGMIKVKIIAKRAYYSATRGHERMHKKGDVIEYNEDHMSTLKENKGTEDEDKKFLPRWCEPVDSDTPVRKAYNSNARPKETTLSEMAKKGSPAQEAEKIKQEEFAAKNASDAEALKKEQEEFAVEKKKFEDTQKKKK